MYFVNEKTACRRSSTRARWTPARSLAIRVDDDGGGDDDDDSGASSMAGDSGEDADDEADEAELIEGPAHVILRRHVGRRACEYAASPPRTAWAT